MKTKATRLIPTQKYTGIGGSEIVCHVKVRLDIHLRIIHGTSFVLRNVIWRVAENEGSNVIIGRPLLESLGINNRGLSEAACDKQGGVVDTQGLNQEHSTAEQRKVCLLLKDTVFHSAGGAEGDGLEEQDVYIDLGEDSP